jgi:hypothetical protein
MADVAYRVIRVIFGRFAVSPLYRDSRLEANMRRGQRELFDYLVARASNDAGTESRSVLAVSRLIASSNFGGRLGDGTTPLALAPRM